MSTVEIKITSTGLDMAQASALSNFLISLNTTAPEVVEVVKEPVAVVKEPVAGVDFPVPVVEAPEAPKQTRTRAKKEKPAEVAEIEVNEPEEVKPEEVEETTSAPEPEEETQEEPAEEEKPTLMQIRTLVAQKSAAHKDTLRAKLKEYGAANVSTLEEKHFSAFYEFTSALA